jgi:amino acid adenylation domain-containing protein
LTEPTISPEVHFATPAGMLRARAEERPGQVAFTFLADGQTEAGRLTYAALDARARAVAIALRAAVAPGERALLLFPPGLDFIAAFFGCLYAGVVAVPAYPPRPHDRSQARLRAIARDAEPRVALTTSAVMSGLAGLTAVAPELAAVRWIATDALASGNSGRDLAEPDPESTAFLQYTSGSIAEPKGVEVTHANLLHNERMIGAAFEQDESSVVVGWLPLYHDMGLIGTVLQPLHAGGRCVLMSPVAFLQRPLRWLEAISRYRGTTSGGPNFAYELCVRKATPEALAGLDLASWRVAFNGAEPVRAETLERFAETFASTGFRAEAFYPCYGLAEATLFVAGGLTGRRPRVARVEPAALERNEVVIALSGDPDARRLVSSGRPWMDQKIMVADPETGAECPAGQVGEIWIAGPSVARGYWRNPEATARDFKAFLGERGSDGPFLRTGDLGFLADGELYVTGRLKDLIILRGRNHYPQDLERTAEGSHPDLRPGNAAAFAVEAGGEERLVIALEVERRRRDGFEEVAEAVRRAVAEEHEVQVWEVVLLRAGTLPKTSSGKVQRGLCRRQYLAEDLAVLGRSALAADPAVEPVPEIAVAVTRDGLAALEPAERRPLLIAWLRERAAAVLGTAAAAVTDRQALTSLGLDSLTAVELKGSVEAALGLPLPLAELLRGAGLGELADGLLAELDTAPVADVPPRRALSLQGDQPLSPGQRALWFLERLAPEAGAYNVAVAARVRSGLDVSSLVRAFAVLTARHEALRTAIREVDGEPVQQAEPNRAPDFAVVQAREWSEEGLLARLGQEAWRPFDLTAGSPLRMRVYERAGGEWVLLFAVHHAVCDFWSLALAARELGASYAGEALPPPALQYSDFVCWQADLLTRRGERLWDFWRQALDGVRDLDLPADRPRPPVQTWRGLSRTAELPADLAGALRGLAASQGATLFAALVAAFQAQLGRYSGQDDFAVGTPTAGRGAPEWAGVVGYFVNPVALRADLAGDPPFRTLIERASRTALAGLEHAVLPVVLLAERLRPVRDPARPPLFQAMLTLQRGRPADDPGLPAFALGEDGTRIRLGGLELESIGLAERRAQFEVSLSAAELPSGGLGLSLEVNAGLFDGATAERMLGHFRTLLAAAVGDVDRPLSDLPLLTAAEMGELLHDWSVPAAVSAPAGLLHERVAARAAESPGALAVVAEGAEEMTYGELVRRAGELARHLRGLGVGPEMPVALCVERSADLVVGALGILAAGGVYLPLDPDSSPARLGYILEDAAAAALVTQRRIAGRLPETGAPLVFLDEALDALPPVAGEPAPPVQILPEHLAYVIYTSGSTGRPKGVAVTHAAAAEHCLTWGSAYRLTAADRVLQFPSAGFDAAVEQIFSALLAGATLVLRGPEPWGTRELGGKIAALGLTVTDLPAAFFSRWVQDAGDLEAPESLRLLGTYGEELRTETVRRWRRTALAHVPLLNCYGPTEGVISATLQAVRPEDGDAGPVPIGRALPGRVARVLDRHGNPQPVGLPGELCLGGLLARGYLGRPDLTAERFVPDAFGVPGSRLYRSGDLARRRPDGALEFLGRLDDQVKIRGVRVEPGEIEAVLREHSEVREAAVLALASEETGGERRLVAFVAPGLPEDLRGFLRDRLPDAMIPAAWVALPALPLNVNGKVDRAALAVIARDAAGAESLEQAGADAPRTPDEELLAGIWAALLERERVGVHDDFFALGGHSLLATRLVARVARVFGVELPLSAVFQAPTVARLAERIAGMAAEVAAPPVRQVPRVPGEALPLSFAQRRLWFLEQLEPGTALYNVPGEVRLAGPLDVAALSAAWNEVLQRHEALRTVFPVRDGEPFQRVEPAPSGALFRIDLSGLPADLRQAETERLAATEAGRLFDLARGPLCRGLLLRLGVEEHRLLVTFHHIVSDGWSLGLFLDELSALYGGAMLPGLPVQYADYAAWQTEGLAGGVLERQLAYWRERLAGLPVLELPADRPRPAVRDPRGAVRSLVLPAETVEAVERLARREGVTLFMALLAAFQALLARLTGEAAIPVGTPVANRRSSEVERLIGLFVNTLVLDVEVEDDPDLRELLARVREAALGAYAHQDLPFEVVVEELRPSRGLGKNPLFQTMLVLEEPLPARTAAGLALEPVRRHSGTAKLDLLLAVSPRSDGGWDMLAEYAAALFEPVTIDRLLGHWRTLLEGAAAADPSQRLSALPLLTAAERQQVAAEWNDTAVNLPEGLCLHDLVAAQAARTPDAVAVVGERERITYRELMARAERLSGYLRGLSVGPEARVGLCLERTPDLVAAILGVLQAGAAYVPLDPAYPQERLELMLADSGAELLVTESALAGRFDFFGDPSVLIDRIGRISPISPIGRIGATQSCAGNLAYVIYTSGSTGRPKGVAIEHRSAVTLVHWALESFPRADLEGVLAATSVCFDLSIFEIFVPLATGGRVIVAPNVVGLPQLAATAEVTLVNAVPSPMAELVEGRLPAGLRTVNLAGEALKADLVERLYAHPQVERVVNLYGPSEDTTYSTWRVVPRGASLVTIGRPIANTRARVLGQYGEPLPVGVPGELFLAGDGLARGYLGRPELTADRFVPDPSGSYGGRMYRTGDRARLLPDGQLDFLGRLDHQVKLHGFRMELGEIEAALERHPAVRQAVAVLRSDEGRGERLVGYVVLAEGVNAAEAAELTAELAGSLRALLPGPMVPTAWSVLPALPLSPNGKVDRRALPAPAQGQPAAAGDAAPRTAIEEKLAAVWRQVLGLERLGIHDDFFALGGHSLLAVRAAFRTSEAFGVEVPVAALFQAPTVAGLAQWLDGAHPEISAVSPIPAAPAGVPHPLSFAQQRLWLLDRLHPGSAAYNVGVALRLTGTLEEERLAASLGEVMRRHEPLRTVYLEHVEDPEPVQVVLPFSGPAPLPRLDLDGPTEVSEVIRAEVARPFDLQRGPVVRFLLLRLAAAEHVLVITVHHIAADGWSLQILLRDLGAAYGSTSLPLLPLRYADWALWQRQFLSAPVLDAQLGYWRRELGGVPALELPTDKPRPAVLDPAGWSRRLDLSPELTQGLREQARSVGTTLFSVLLGGFFALLARQAGQDDFAVGIAAAGRGRPELEELIGFFVSTLALRAPLIGDPGFGELVRRVRDKVREAQDHEDVPFERVVEELQPARDAARTPIFQAMLSLLSTPAEALHLPGLEVDFVDYETTAAKLDLTLSLHEMEGGVTGALEYRASLFEPATIERMAGHYQALLAGAAADPARRVSELPLLSPAERWQLSGEWNDTAAAYPRNLCLHELVAAQAARTPDAPALVTDGGVLSYVELMNRSTALAGRLRHAGVGPETVVGLCVERSPEMVTGMLAILQSGGAWLSLDPGYPPERLALLLEDAGASVVLTRAELRERLPAMPAVLFEAGGDGIAGGPSANPDNLACVLYTSGSTGRPKGVMLPHRGLVNRLLWAQETYRLTAADTLLFKASFSFDFSIWEVFAPLLAGARLVVARPDGHQDAAYLAHTIARHGVTVVHFVPTLLAAFLREEGIESCTALRQVFSGGEVLSPGLRDRFLERLPGVPLDNQYGPTEISIDTTRWVCAPGQEPDRVPIGRPIGNARVLLLDPAGQYVPMGVAGRLHVGGPGMARGYLGRPDLTAERFVPDPLEDGERLYDTGDLARRLPDGTLEFLGRADQQVKVRGVRIEPAEVEAALARHPQVRAAAVAADSAGERLLAWIVAAADAVEAEVTPAGLRDFLRRSLPETMVPSRIVRLDTLPLTSTGKLDRRALPEPETGPAAGAAVTAPLSAAEELLAGLWADVLGVERVGPEADFFDLGGHSLLATRLASRVRAVFGVDVPLSLLFEAPTPAALARRLAMVQRETALPEIIPVPRAPEGMPLSYSQRRLWFLHRLEPESPAYNVPGALRLRGALRPEALAAALSEIARRHESLRTVFRDISPEPLQVILDPAPAILPRIDLSALPEDRREAEARRLLAAQARRPFDLASGPLARTALIRLGAEDHLLAVVMHHIVSDAWSLEIVLRELAALYRGEVLPSLPVQYADFAVWQRSWLAGEVLAGELAHWRRVLAGAPESLELPADRPRPAVPTWRAGQIPFVLPEALLAGLRSQGRREGWTLFMVLLAAFDALLARHTGQTDLVVGSPIANRNRLETEGLIGFFTNTLALRLDLGDDPAFAEIARQARAATLEAYKHQDLPFERLVEELAPERLAGRTPLFQVMLVLRDASSALELPGIAADVLDVEIPTAKFDLTLYVDEDAGSLEFNRDLFDDATTSRFVERFATLLAGAGAMPEARLSDLPLLPAAERRQLLDWGRSPVPHPRGLRVHDLVAAQAARTPGAPALVFGGDQFTYAELERRAGALARRLRALGVGPDVPVGILCERSVEQWVAVLAVLKAGGAYLPLDPANPSERLRLVVEDAGAPVVLTPAAIAEAAGAAGDGEPGDPGTDPANLAYLLYTSGSTGRPKGVAMSHEAAVNMLSWQLRTSGAGVGTRTLQFAPFAFDVSFQEAFSTWASGGTLVLVSEETRRDAPALLRLLAAERVERLFVPLVALQQLAVAAGDGDDLPLALREVMAAGEQLYVTPQVRALFSALPGALLHNHYGPTETHAATWLTLDGDPAGWPERPAIGRPLDNARVLLLGPAREAVPAGVPGELYVGGAGLARSYLARPDLTAERFVPHPFASEPGERLYRTGDLARWLPDGMLELLGRGDDQVKVRGYRIELAEVQIALARHPSVLQAVAGVRGGEAGVKRLAAWCVFRDGVPGPSWTELRAFLAATLPEFMVPTLWMRLDALPLTGSGKVSRLALPAPEAAAGGGAGFVAPSTPLEELLAGIWTVVLGVERVGLHDSFFDLGGHSLLATQVISRVREACAVDLPLRRLFEAPTLEELARAVEAARDSGAEAPAPILPADRAAGLPLSFAQERLWFLDRLQGGGSVYNVPLVMRLQGRLDAEGLAAALREVVRRHETLRTVFPERDGEPAQEIVPPSSASDWTLSRVDLAGLPAVSREAERERLAAEESRRPFDLARGPLLRAALLRLGPEDHALLLTLHHIVSDLWSMGVLMREVAALYGGIPLPGLPVQYADFAAWQRRWLAGERLERQIGYWRWRLQGLPAGLELPADHPRPAVATSRGAQRPFALDADLSARLVALGRREGATPFMVLASALLALLSRLSGQPDLALGSPIANRNRLETEGLVGFFVNTLVLRADLGDLGGARTFRDLLRQLRETTLGAYAHQDLPFEKLVEELQPDRDLSRTPFFQVVLALQNAPLVPTALPGLALSPEEVPAGTAKFDLSFVLAHHDGRFAGVLEYATDLFEPATAARLCRHLAALLAAAVADASAAPASLPLLAPPERHQLLAEWNDTARPAPLEMGDPLIQELFEAWADADPHTLAAVCEGESLTYGELEERANRLAGLLRRLGAGPAAPVGIWMERSLDLVIALLGALKAGAAYLPLDVSWPAERVETILAGTGAGILVAGASRLAAVEELKWRLPHLADIVCLDVASPAPEPEPLDAAGVTSLWDFVAERAVDRVTAGGFVSSATGEPFTEAEVDEYRDRVVALAAPWLRPAARVLEIGSGSGLILWEIAPRVARYVGLDPSHLTQERNRERAARQGMAHVELPTGFAHEIEAWEPGSFDLVILASTVQFFPGPFYLERVLEAALRLLAPGGAVLVADVLDPRRQEEFRRSLGDRPPAPRLELKVDEDFFGELGQAEIHHRLQGFDNELRFRYDVVLTRDGEERVERRKRLWTGWHVAASPAERPAPRESGAAPEAVAYVIHTSGSTGVPKGIVVQHRPVVNLIRWVNGTFGVGPGDRLLFITSPCFDLSVYDVFGTLAAGATVQVASEAALRDPERLAGLLTSGEVTIWDSAPAALQQLVPLFNDRRGSGRAAPLRLALLSGDWIPVPLPDQVRTAFPGTRVVSFGGATEAAIWSNWFPVEEVDPRWPSIPYGRPIANARYHVLDRRLEPCPVGVPGGLYIGGDCLCVGYARLPERTAASFLPDPFASRPGARLYATGDRARYKADGNLEFLGRVDFQVKIRGHRIELEEIEAALLRHPGVREAVVLAREDVPGDKRLVGYVVPSRQPAPTTAELRAALQQTLPEPMVPWTFALLDSLPLTVNGKVDRVALSAMSAPRTVAEAGAGFVAPRNELEREIGVVWREVLGLPRVGVHDNFFESGGSSLLIVKLHSRLKAALGVDLPVTELFRHPTIDALARRLAEEPRAEAGQEKVEAARARTRGRQEALQQMSQARAKRRGRNDA